MRSMTTGVILVALPVATTRQRFVVGLAGAIAAPALIALQLRQIVEGDTDSVVAMLC